MSRPVLVVDPFSKQTLFSPIRALEDEGCFSREHDPFLHGTQFQFEDLSKMPVLQRAEDDNLIDPVHKLRRELSSCRLNSGTVHLPINVSVVRVLRFLSRSKSDPTIDQLRHLACAQVRG